MKNKKMCTVTVFMLACLWSLAGNPHGGMGDGMEIYGTEITVRGPWYLPEGATSFEIYNNGQSSSVITGQSIIGFGVYEWHQLNAPDGNVHDYYWKLVNGIVVVQDTEEVKAQYKSISEENSVLLDELDGTGDDDDEYILLNDCVHVYLFKGEIAAGELKRFLFEKAVENNSVQKRFTNKVYLYSATVSDYREYYYLSSDNFNMFCAGFRYDDGFFYGDDRFSGFIVSPQEQVNLVTYFSHPEASGISGSVPYFADTDPNPFHIVDTESPKVLPNYDFFELIDQDPLKGFDVNKNNFLFYNSDSKKLFYNADNQASNDNTGSVTILVPVFSDNTAVDYTQIRRKGFLLPYWSNITDSTYSLDIYSMDDYDGKDISFRAYDYVENESEIVKLNIEKDSDEPEVPDSALQTVELDFNSDSAPYFYVVKFQADGVTDDGSGVDTTRDYTFTVKKIIDNGAVELNADDGGVLTNGDDVDYNQARINLYVWDQLLEIGCTAYDNVSNEGSNTFQYVLTAPGILDTDADASKFVYINNQLQYHGHVKLGAYRNHNSGIDTLAVSLNDQQPIAIQKGVDGFDAAHFFSLTPEGLGPHREYNVKIISMYNNQPDGVAPVTTEHASGFVPNRPPVLTNIETGESIVIEKYENDIGGIINTLDTGAMETRYIRKIENITFNSSDDDEDELSIESFEYEDGYYYIYLIETYTEIPLNGDSVQKKNNYLVTGIRYVVDDEINLDEVELNIYREEDDGDEPVAIVNTGNVYVGLSQLPIEEPGGVDVVYFAVPVPDEGHEYTDDEFSLILANPDVRKYEVTDIAEDERTEFMLEYGDNSELEAGVAARVADKAGNFGYIHTKLLIDRIPPASLVTEGGDGYVISVGHEKIRYDYSYTGDPGVISIVIDESIFEDDRVELDVNESDFGISDTNRHFITFRGITGNVLSYGLAEAYPANEEISVTIVLRDTAGNTTVNEMVFYTPGRITEPDVTFENHHNLPYEDWNEEKGNHILFSVSESATCDRISVYRITGGLETQSPILPEDTSIGPHEMRTYRVYSVNGSGFENREPGSWLEMSASAGNNSPLFVVDEGSFIAREAVMYFGPSTMVSYELLDRDGDACEIAVYINDGTEPVYKSNENTVLVSSALGYPFLNGEEYRMRIGVTDLWGGDGRGSEILYPADYNSLVLVYDDQPPAADRLFEKENGFSHVNGNLYMNVRDDGAGLDERTFRVFVNGSEVNEKTVMPSFRDGFNYALELDEGFYELVVKATDVLANDGELLRQEIVVDKTPPVIEGMRFDPQHNPFLLSDGNIFPNGNASLTLDWTDENRPARVSYEYYTGLEKVAEGIVNVDGRSLGTGNGTVVVAMPDTAQLLEENTVYRLIVSVADRAGNWSEAQEIFLGYDLSAPVVELAEPWNVYKYGTVNYVTTTYIPAPVVSVTDSVDAEVTPVYILYDVENDVYGGEYSNIEDIVLSDGEYVLNITARDRSGHSTVLKLGFICDMTAPSGLSIDIRNGKKNEYAGGEYVSVDFTGTGADYYYYQLFESGDSEALTRDYPGADEDGWVRVSAGNASGYTMKLPRVNGSGNMPVIMRIKASDHAGNMSASVVPNDGNFIVRSDRESVAVSINPHIGMKLNNDAESYGVVNGTWVYYPANAAADELNCFAYRLYRNGEEIVSGTIRETSVSLELEGLEHQDQMYLSVEAVMDSGRVTDTFESLRANVDFESPVITGVSAPSWATSNNLSVEWEISDTDDVARIIAYPYWFSLDKESEEPVLIENRGTPVELGTSLRGTAVLPDEYAAGSIGHGDSVIIYLVAEDRAGNTCMASSGVIRIDNTPPETFCVIDQGEYVNPSVNDLYFDWLWSADDVESPVEYTYYQLSVNGVIDESSWKELDTSGKDVTLSGIEQEFDDGSYVLISVKKVNAAGLATVGKSNGITLDSTAGFILGTDFTRRESADPVYFYTHERELRLWVSGYDELSGVSRITGELGYFEGTEWKGHIPESIASTGDSEILDIELPQDFGASKIFRYRVVLYDNAGTPSLPAYTRALYYDPAAPHITAVTGSFGGNTMNISWESSLLLPFLEGRAELVDSQGSVKRIIGLDADRGLESFATDIPQNEIEDGEYRFRVILTDMSNKSVARFSNSFIKDTTGPVIGEFVADEFAADSVSFSFKASESLSLYSCKLGTVENDEAFTGAWIDRSINGSVVWANGIDLTQFGNMECIDQSQMLLTVRCFDIYGNSSASETRFVTIDMTPPSAPEITKNRDITFFGETFTLDASMNYLSTTIDGISWIAADSVSGIKGYVWAIIPADTVVNGIVPDIADSEWSGPVTAVTMPVCQADFSGVSMNDGEKYYIAMRSINGSGLYSDIGLTNEPFTVDLSSPAFSISTDGYAAATTVNSELPAYNGEGMCELVIDNEASNPVYYRMELIDPSNNIVYYANDFLDTSAGECLIPFIPSEDVHGEYVVRVSMYDPGMNMSVREKAIRYNAPPGGVLPEQITANPARPFELKGRHWVFDQDGIAAIRYTILLGDTEIWSTQEVAVNGEFPFEYPSAALDHANITNQLTQYELKVEAEDSLGMVTRKNTVIYVVNTQKGRLYTNEYWSDLHVLTGSVEIPPGLSLTIAAGTTVRVDTGAVNGYGQTLLVSNGATLVHEGSALYYNDDPYGTWGGLIIQGSVNLEQITVKDAERGITLDSSDVYVIDACVLEDNMIGVHLVNAGAVTITNTVFRSNQYYGIKEERGADNPVVTGCRFRENGFDYYDTGLTVLYHQDIDGLNENNEGNRGE